MTEIVSLMWNPTKSIPAPVQAAMHVGFSDGTQKYITNGTDVSEECDLVKSLYTILIEEK